MLTHAKPEAERSFLSELESGSLGELAPKIPFWKGMQIGVQGQPCDHLYIISRGQVLLSRRGDNGDNYAIQLLGAEDLFGEGSLQPERRWLVSARAVTDGAAHMLPAAHIPRLAQYYPRLMTQIVRLLSERIERAHRRADVIRTSGARDQVLALIRALAGRHGQPQGDEIWVPMTITQEELGEMIGISRETVARAISDLEDQGLLRHRRRRGFWLPVASESWSSSSPTIA